MNYFAVYIMAVTVACLCYPWRSIKLILRMLRTALRRAVSSQP